MTFHQTAHPFTRAASRRRRAAVEPLEGRVLLSAAAAADPFAGRQTALEHTVTATTVADVNGDAVPDLITVGHTGSQPNTTWRFGDGTGAFAGGGSVQVGRGVVSVETADLNGDGHLDVLMGGSSEVAVLFNTGTGALGGLARYSATADGVAAVAPSDVDRDGDVDLVALNSTQKHIAVFRNAGNGTFATPPITYSTTNAYGQLVVADLDADADPDVAVTGFGFEVRVLKNGGTGSFSFGSSYTLPDATSDLDAADLDSDGDTDLLASNYSYGAFTVFRNGGNATFTTTRIASTQIGPEDSVLADFDGDGDTDVVVAQAAYAHVMHNNGNGTSFTPGPVFGIGGTALTLLSADLNRDGSPDLVARQNLYDSTPDTVSTPINAGGGEFGSRRSLLGRGGRAVATGDWDRDGRPDLATVSSTLVNVLRNTGGTTFELTTAFNGDGARDVAAVDVDGDADLDLVTAHESGQKLAVFKNNGTGGFSGPTNYAINRVVSRVVAGDFNGDGRPDLAAITRTSLGSEYSLAVLLNNPNGTGTFGAATHFAVTTQPFDLAAVNVDADADLDLIVATGTQSPRVYTNDGAGGFGTVGTVSVSSAPYALAVGDLANDGRPDVVSVNTFGSVSVLPVLPGGGFGTPVTYGAGYRNENVALFDADDDGDLDVASSNADNDSVSVLKNNGDGTLAAERRYVTNDFPQGLAAADFNGDGYDDLAAVALHGNDVAFLLNRGPTPLDAPSWLAPGNAATWEAATRTLTVTGPTTLDAAPAVAPAINADGPAAVLTINAGAGGATRLRELRLSNGAAARMIASGVTPGALAGRHALVIDSPGGLTIDATGTLDLADAALVLKGGNLAAVQAAITSAFHGGDWLGPGITSATARADADRASGLGYATAGDLGATTFNGVTGLSTGDVIVRHTWLGDTNLDGAVNTDDILNILAAGKLDTPSPATWFEGDFTYDNRANTDDILEILATGQLDQ